MKSILFMAVFFPLVSFGASPVKEVGCALVTRAQSVCLLKSQAGNDYLMFSQSTPGRGDRGGSSKTTIVPVQKKSVANEKGVGANKFIHSGFSLQAGVNGNLEEVSFELSTYVPVVPSPSSMIATLKIDGAAIGGETFLPINP